MKEFLSLALLFWIPPFIVLFKSIFWDLYFWQIKEYRFDRFWTYIRWDQEETNRNTGDLSIKFILFALVSTFFVYPVIAITGMILTYAYWFNQSVFFVNNVVRKKIKRPSFKNPRNILILTILLIAYIATASFITIPFAIIDRDDTSGYTTLINDIGFDDEIIGDYVYPDAYLFLGIATLFALLMDFAAPFVVAFLVGLTHPIARFKRKRIIAKAKKLLKTRKKKLIIVGITGSEGKTTTKELLYNLLKDHYKTIKTPANYNTDVGVALAILDNIKEDTQIFVAEMGALRKGEIKAATDAFPPDVAIVTTLDRQHVGIFGSKQQLFEAKSELVQGMRHDGTAVLNGDIQMVRNMEPLHQGKTIFVTHDEKLFRKHVKNIEPLVSANLIKETSSNYSSMRLTLKTEEAAETFTIPQQGDHLFTNISLAITAAHELGLTLKQIKKSLNQMDYQLPRQSIFHGDNETTIINDTYNSSFNGFVAAVERMNQLHRKNTRGKRIIISKGILELGRYKSGTYEELMKKIKTKFDVLVTTDNLLYQAARRNNLQAHITKVTKPEEMLYEIRKHEKKHDVLLLEGRLDPIILQALISDQS